MKRTQRKNSKSGPGKQKDSRGNCLSRKAKRKAERKKKKEKMNQSYLQRFSKVKPSLESLEDITQKKGAQEMEKFSKEYTPPEKKSKRNAKEYRPKYEGSGKKDGAEIQPDFEMDAGKHRRQVEDAVMVREKKQLAQLEKKLKMKNRATLPKSFLDDGLDFLLDVVDSNKLYSMHEERELLTGSELKPKKAKERSGKKLETSSTETKSQAKNQLKGGKKVRFQMDEDDWDEAEDFEENSEGDSDKEMISDGKNMDDEDEMDMDEEEMANTNNAEDEEGDDDEEEDGDDLMGMDEDEEEDDEDTGMIEDIYGRQLDSKGNLISNKEQGGAYIPPAKRAAMLAGSGQEAVELDRLKKQMKGLLNRASESNLQSIANSVEDLYMHHSRAAVNLSLFSLIQEAVVSPIITPERLVAEMVMLVTVLHGNVGSEVGAYFLQHVVKKYEELRHQNHYGEEHTMDNVVLLLCYLYNFKVAHHSLLFEVMSQLVEAFSEKDIELLLLVLKTSGFYLRRDDPESLGNQITAIQQKARGLEEGGVDVPSRVRFMLEVLVAVRNNNVRRVPGADLERSDRLRQLAGKFVRGGSLGDSQLNIGLRDLLQAEDKGRWWIVGSAWEGRLEADRADTTVSGTTKGVGPMAVVGAVNQKLVALAKKLRINSDVRRSIFYVIMSSEDYEDAFQKVLGLGLRGQQQQEIVVVATLCCKHQASYNPFYSFLLQKLATHDRKFMIAIQFHMWDIFKTMDELSSSSRRNLAAMLAHLLASKSLSLSVLKVLEFGILNQAMVKFLRHLFTALLDSASMKDLRDIFKAVAQLEKFRTLTVGLRMFLVKQLKLEGELKKKLVEVCNELSQNHQMFM